MVFVDYQNVYRGARSAFHDHSFDPHWFGQVWPHKLGGLIADRKPDRTLHQVRIYRGLPSAGKDPKGYSPTMRQIDTWNKLPLVDVTARPLRYPHDYPRSKPEEKGIDVQIAIDFVMMAVNGLYDVGVLMSGDTDLIPELEAVDKLPDIEAEVAAWRRTGGYGQRLRLKGSEVWCHWIDDAAYQTIRDDTDYNRKRRY